MLIQFGSSAQQRANGEIKRRCPVAGCGYTMAQEKAEASRDYGKPVITLKYVNSFLNAKSANKLSIYTTTSI
jgi:hypothetical protein